MKLPSSLRMILAEGELGPVLLARSELGVCAIFLGDDRESLLAELQFEFPGVEIFEADVQCTEFMDRLLQWISAPRAELDLPLDLRGSQFQLRVWQAMREIPLGATLTYAQLAERIDSPQAARAVASVCAANKVALLVPCHRVVRSDGTPSGYRWGIERKLELLRREQMGS
jgi:AraC family transcriptional regulator of adaptative response/methylated-DNA-[protein]-cysteine methyltransferase